MILRLEQLHDIAAIHAVHKSAFPTDAEARLVEALREAKRLSLSFVAEVDRRVVGRIGFTPLAAWRDKTTPDTLIASEVALLRQSRK